jgi:Arylsulfotransferase (ASST)/Secretion system C-terminal sorting domain
VIGNPIWYGGGGAIVEIRDWNNNLEWSYEVNDSLRRLHHDISVMPNGNILMIVWVTKTKNELIATGRDTSRYKNDVLHSEQIIEVNPKTNQVVWAWDMWDHIIQDYDSTKQNFGVVSAHPEKIDINYPQTLDGSWFHMNSIDYNDELDQIIVSVPTHHEFWIIDHSTTTQQAAKGIGGLAGSGGDLIYRWGNPAVYKKGNSQDQTSFYQHGVHWARNFILPNHPEFGKIVLFNNRVSTNFSQVNTIVPPWDMYEWKYKKTNGIWGPTSYDNTIKHPNASKLHSDILSNAQILPNGNILILSGRNGYIFEITKDNQVVWEYIVPLRNGNQVNQNTKLNINDNTNFRANRYPINFQGFQGKDLSPKGHIELTPNSDYCNILVSNDDIKISHDIKIYPNPSSEYINVFVPNQTQAVLINSAGIKLKDLQLSPGENELNITDLRTGLYFINTEYGVLKAFSVVK